MLKLCHCLLSCVICLSIVSDKYQGTSTFAKPTASPSEDQIAARYQLRGRTQSLFERSKGGSKSSVQKA